MTAKSNISIILSTICWFVVLAGQVSVCSAVQDDKTEFFESRIRPVLIEHCYPCHNSIDQTEADFSLDWRTGIRSKTEHGTAVVPGKPGESLLLKVIQHQIEGLEMPEDGAKLDPKVIADIEKWIADGAADPRDDPPSETEMKEATSWEATLLARKKWWSFQPVRNPGLPAPNDWSDHPIDRFIFEAAKSKNLQQGSPAVARVLLRRLSFTLTGLPPTRQQLVAIEPGSISFEQFVDEFLESPRFGERWARHWMDLVRYADTHGSEGDPAIPNAYRYRDYLIRAFNADVPYDQMVREHIAGDLLENPRINQELGINESAIGPAHWRLCFHGFAPTDALDEKVRFTDDQIDVFSKSFLGLTISCARCHDHKFDPISQADYYAIFGIVGSCRPAMKDVNIRDKQELHQSELGELKQQIKTQLAEEWLVQAGGIADRLISDDAAIKTLVEKANSPTHALGLWQTVIEQSGEKEDFESAWQQQVKKWQNQNSKKTTNAKGNFRHWNLAIEKDFREWFEEGNPELNPAAAGDFALATGGDNVVSAIYPAGVFTNLLTDRHRGVLGSPRFNVEEKLTAWFRCVGGGQPTARYVVQNYPRSGTVYPIKDINNRDWHWQQFDLEYWSGDEAHLEITTAKDAPLQVRKQDRSWFGVRDVVVRETRFGPPAELELEFMSPVFDTAKSNPPRSKRELARIYASATTASIGAWKNGSATDEQALFLDALVRDSVLSNTLESLPSVRDTVERFRDIEGEVPLPFRVPGMAEADSFDQPLFERGDHRKPLEPVSRRFLEAIDPTPYQTRQSGRLELAQDLFRPDNPLTSRVIVNRIWLHLFGRGLVSTPDNFGKLGSKPTHPELLDFLATRMVEQNWSVKEMIRFIVLSKTWQQTSSAPGNANEIDPENNLLTHFNLKRLDAESIRDSMVEISGSLNDEMYGPSFAPNSMSDRRAIYVRSQRNNLDQFLATFDSPVPFATTGRRNVTNVPAQSLTMLNSPFVIQLANKWASHARKESPSRTDKERIESMFEAAIGRKPTHRELDSLDRYLRLTEKSNQFQATQKTNLASTIADSRAEIQAILEPVQKRLKARTGSAEASQGPEPLARWNFSEGLADTIGGLKMSLRSNARIENGALILDGNGFALSDPIPKPIAARTLEAWVQLDTLDQQGGGVVTIQNLAGHVFDSIVFAELKNNRWLAGSNHHDRTLTFDGKAEKDAAREKVHLAIIYGDDGTITGYRNGKPYGKPIRKSGIQKYEEQKTKIAIGIRHGKATSSGRMLNGKIFEVRLYNRALSKNEVAASFSGQPVVSEADVLAKLSQAERDRVVQLRKLISERERDFKQFDSALGPHDPLARIAHAIFNLKEFIYVR